MSVRDFREQKGWGTRTFDESMRVDGKSEEDDMGVSCVRGESIDHGRSQWGRGVCNEHEVPLIGLLTRLRSDRGRSCKRVNAYVDKEQDKFFC